LVRCHVSLHFPQYAGSPRGRSLVQTSLTMSDCTQLKTRINIERKERFAAVARHQGLSESGMLKRLAELMLQTTGAGETPVIPEPRRSGRSPRLTLRLRADDQMLLRERAATRGMQPATYVSVLTRARLRGLAPLPKEELLMLKRTVSELGGIGRNLNQIARGSQPIARVSSLICHKAAPHTTYQMTAGYWPTAQAIQAERAVADATRRLSGVFSLAWHGRRHRLCRVQPWSSLSAGDLIAWPVICWRHLPAGDRRLRMRFSYAPDGARSPVPARGSSTRENAAGWPENVLLQSIRFNCAKGLAHAKCRLRSPDLGQPAFTCRLR
jgi:hypothetical protein